MGNFLGRAIARDRHTREGGYPVRRGLSAQSLAPLEYWITRPSAQLRTRRVMTTGDDTASRSRDALRPRLAIEFPHPPNRGRRECRVHAAPAVSCAKVCKKAHTSIQVQRRHPTFPAQWLYGLYRALPGRAGLVVTVASGMASTGLTPASGRQDHTTSPYASAPSVKGTSASTASHPASVTIAKRPSYRDGTKSIYF